MDIGTLIDYVNNILTVFGNVAKPFLEFAVSFNDFWTIINGNQLLSLLGKLIDALLGSM